MKTEPYAFTDQEYEDALWTVLERIYGQSVGATLYIDSFDRMATLYHEETIAYIDDYAAQEQQPCPPNF
jgi:hypothetical protein